jgi:hypothetical protein
MLNYQLSQKLKLIRKSKFNHLIISLTPPSSVSSNFLLIGGPTHEIFNLNEDELTKSRFNPITFGFDTMLRFVGGRKR